MAMLQDTSRVMAKTRELCRVITEDMQYQELLDQVERFLDDEGARLQFQSVQERGMDLQEKQNAGLAVGEAEMRDFENAREALLENPVAKAFIEAQQTLQNVQVTIGKYVGMALELGRVPEESDFAKGEGGCCGDGGCGCSH